MFLAKRGRPDFNPATSFLLAYTQAPTQQDWFKLVKTVSFFKNTTNNILISLEGDDNRCSLQGSRYHCVTFYKTKN